MKNWVQFEPSHQIRNIAIEKYLLAGIRGITGYVQANEDNFVEMITKRSPEPGLTGACVTASVNWNSHRRVSANWMRLSSVSTKTISRVRFPMSVSPRCPRTNAGDHPFKVLDTSNDKEKVRKLEIELDQDYMELGQELRAIGKTELGENESYENALAAYETKNQFLQELIARIADKDKRCFDALQFADRLEDITNIKFSEVLWCSLIDHVSVPTGGKKSLIFHLRNGGAIDIVLDQ